MRNQDQDAALFIGLLLVLSKNNARMQRELGGQPADSDMVLQSTKAAKEYFEIMDTCLKAFNEDPQEMERKVLEFARRIGFTVEQHYVGNASKRKQ